MYYRRFIISEFKSIISLSLDESILQRILVVSNRTTNIICVYQFWLKNSEIVVITYLEIIREYHLNATLISFVYLRFDGNMLTMFCRLKMTKTWHSVCWYAFNVNYKVVDMMTWGDELSLVSRTYM